MWQYSESRLTESEAGFSDERQVDTQARVRSDRPWVPLASELKSRFLKIERVSSEGDVSVRVTYEWKMSNGPLMQKFKLKTALKVYEKMILRKKMHELFLIYVN